MSVLKPDSWEMAMIVHAVNTARKVAGVVKIRARVFQMLSATMVWVASRMLISIDWIFARRCSSVDVG
jgi:hypothetical protein